MHWLNDHVPPTADETAYRYGCTHDDCDWVSPALPAMIRSESVQEQRHPQHRVELLDDQES